MATELATYETDADDETTELITQPEVFNRGELDVQITTARRYPRSIKSFRIQALDMATLDEETASGCFYALPRGGKNIEGPSVRLAEIVLSAWGNIRAESRVVEVGERELTAEGVCWDLEKNIAVRTQVRRRITDSKGKRYKDDMIVVTGNAACSIALRNAVFKVIPMAYTRAIYLEARRVAIGDAKTLTTKRAEMVGYFGKMGVPPERVCIAVGRPSVEDITLDDMATLKGLATAIKDGDTTVDEAFPLPEAPKSIADMKPTAKPKNGTTKKPAADAGEIITKAAADSLRRDCIHVGIEVPSDLDSFTPDQAVALQRLVNDRLDGEPAPEDK